MLLGAVYRSSAVKQYIVFEALTRACHTFGMSQLGAGCEFRLGGQSACSYATYIETM